jgi:alkanesulfonate monooxygenase SsuD/methylene tetrahydromethanopterin reductase-like flavin-dependent oxidoreductase (luciferase family)
MEDWGRKVKFGVFVIPTAEGDPMAEAMEAERLGLDYVGVQDHPYQRRFFDTFALLSMMAAGTTSIGLFPDVACLPLRPPAMMAKTALSIDVLSGGRFELGLGAGAFWDAIVAYGGQRLGPGESLDAMEEAIEVIRKVWSGERTLRFDGAHFHLAGAQSGPVPAHPIGIWLGVNGPRALGIAGRISDGWIPSLRGDLSRLAEQVEGLDEAADRAGRDPGELRRILNVGGTITDGASTGLFQGPVEQWVDQITSLVIDYGFDTFIASSEGPNHLERFANEVAPAVRERVAAERRT